MKFRYHKFNLSPSSDFFGKQILKPIIPIKILKANIVLQYAALIDSGADFCIFDAGLGEYLGLNIIGIIPLGIIIVSVLKPIFGQGHWFLFYANGVGEATLYLLLNRFLNHPENFLLALVVVYFINQLGRIFHISFRLDEAITFLGFLSLLGLGYVFGWI